MEKIESIGELIRIQRVIRGYSQEYMAFQLEISQPAYSKIERNESEITVIRVYEIAEILEISPFEIMPKPKYGSSINFKGIRGFFRKAGKALKIFRSKKDTPLNRSSD